MSARERYRKTSSSTNQSDVITSKAGGLSNEKFVTSPAEYADETPSDYLYHNETTNILKGALEKIIDNKPDDPITFLCNYFASPSTNHLKGIHEKLNWCHYTQKSYENNIFEAYNELIQISHQKYNKGLIGEIYNELLYICCERLPNCLQVICVQKLQRVNLQAISFTRFYHDMLLLHVLQDYILIACDLYKDLDTQSVGVVSKQLCENMLSELQKNVDRKDIRDLSTMLENTKISIDKTRTREEQTKGVEETEFLTKAVTIFLNAV